MSYRFDEAFAELHAFLASTVRAAGPWAVPMVLATAGIVALAHRDRLLSGFGVFLVLGTAVLIVIVYALQAGRI